MMPPDQPLEKGRFYHVYTRGNNREDLFREARNYAYFLALWMKYVEPVAETYAYCLMKNHFHFLIRIRDSFSVAPRSDQDPKKELNPSKQLSNALNAYAKAINKAYNRTGSLFQERFRRKEVTSDAYFTTLIAYIHANPQRHGFVNDFREYPYSSYQSLLSDKPTRLRREAVRTWFGSTDEFCAFHDNATDWSTIRHLIED